MRRGRLIIKRSPAILPHDASIQPVGVARWVVNFTPPTLAYADYTVDPSRAILLDLCAARRCARRRTRRTFRKSENSPGTKKAKSARTFAEAANSTHRVPSAGGFPRRSHRPASCLAFFTSSMHSASFPCASSPRARSNAWPASALTPDWRCTSAGDVALP